MDRMSFIRALRSGLLLFACCIAMPALGDDIYFSVEGQIQGRILGEMTQKGLEGKMRALSFESSIDLPIDIQSGTPTGKRRHHPLRVTREPGRGTPQLLRAMATTETLKEVRFDFYGLRLVNGVKALSLYQTIRLTNAVLVEFGHSSAAATDLSAGAVRSLEKLEFMYQRIEIIDVERGVTVQDDWVTLR